jgi:hypothetical protein
MGMDEKPEGENKGFQDSNFTHFFTGLDRVDFLPKVDKKIRRNRTISKSVEVD